MEDFVEVFEEVEVTAEDLAELNASEDVVADTKDDLVFDCSKGDTLKDLKANGIKLGVGKKATIILRENRSTGYGWEINNDKVGDFCTLEDSSRTDAAPEGFTGVGG